MFSGVIIKSISLTCQILALVIYRPPPAEITEEKDLNLSEKGDDTSVNKQSEEDSSDKRQESGTKITTDDGVKDLFGVINDEYDDEVIDIRL